MEQPTEMISLAEIAEILWSRWRLIVALGFIFASAALALAFILPPKYEASIVLSPIEDSVSTKLGGAGSLLSQFGGLAGITGLGREGSRRAEAIATLQSAALTQTFIAENQLLPILYSGLWDAGTQKWTTSDPDEVPTLWKAEIRFRKKIRSIVEEKKTGLITMTIAWKDPVQAANWANELVARTNHYLRARAIEQSNRNLAYLNEQLTKTSVVDLQKAIYSLIEDEIKKVMIANGSEEYVFRVIDPARVPELRSSPKRLLMTVIGALSGILIGTLLTLSQSRQPASRD